MKEMCRRSWVIRFSLPLLPGVVVICFVTHLGFAMNYFLGYFVGM